jgi:hypothetical protein
VRFWIRPGEAGAGTEAGSGRSRCPGPHPGLWTAAPHGRCERCACAGADGSDACPCAMCDVSVRDGGRACGACLSVYLYALCGAHSSAKCNGIPRPGASRVQALSRLCLARVHLDSRRPAAPRCFYFFWILYSKRCCDRNRGLGQPASRFMSRVGKSRIQPADFCPTEIGLISPLP